MTTIAVSGGFDPLHIGHLEMIEAAAEYGNVIAFVDGDQFLLNKKGYVFMPHAERLRIVGALKAVSLVIPTYDPEHGTALALRKYRPDYFLNGGDRNKPEDVKEAPLCKELGIKLVFNGYKKQSSSELCKARELPVSK